MRHKKVEAVFSALSDSMSSQFVHGASAFPKSIDVPMVIDEVLADADEGLNSDVEEKDKGEERSFSSSDDEDFNNGRVRFEPRFVVLIA